MSMKAEEFVIEKLKALKAEEKQEVADFVDRLVVRESKTGSRGNASPHIWEELAALGAELPEAAWEKVPRDGSEQHDHYLYGAPKREP